MNIRLFDRIDNRSNGFLNKIEEYLYLDGISGRLGARTFTLLNANTLVSTDSLPPFTWKKGILTAFKIFSYILFPFLPLSALGIKAIERKCHSYKVEITEEQKIFAKTIVANPTANKGEKDLLLDDRELTDYERSLPREELIQFLDVKKTRLEEWLNRPMDAFSDPSNDLFKDPGKCVSAQELTSCLYDLSDKHEKLFTSSQAGMFINPHFNPTTDPNYDPFSRIYRDMHQEECAHDKEWNNYKMKFSECPTEKKTVFAYFLEDPKDKEWQLLLIDKEKRTVEYYDGFAEEDETKQSLCKELEKVAEKLSNNDPTQPRYKFVKKINKCIQEDYRQDGPWAIYFAKQRLEIPEIDFNLLQNPTHEILQFREETALRLEEIKKNRFETIRKYWQSELDRCNRWLSQLKSGKDPLALDEQGLTACERSLPKEALILKMKSSQQRFAKLLQNPPRIEEIFEPRYNPEYLFKNPDRMVESKELIGYLENLSDEHPELYIPSHVVIDLTDNGANGFNHIYKEMHLEACGHEKEWDSNKMQVKACPTKDTSVFAFLINNLNVVHWQLLLIDKKKRTVEYYDSLATKRPGLFKELEKFTKDLSLKESDKPSYRFIRKIENATQHDGYQCGPWTAYFAEERLKNPDVDFNTLKHPTPTIEGFRKKATEKLEKIREKIIERRREFWQGELDRANQWLSRNGIS